MHRDFDLPDTPRGRRLLLADMILTRVLYLSTAIFLLANVIVLLHWAAGNSSVLNRINDCTTPAGQCYHDEQKRTGDAVRQLEEIAIAANLCSRTATTLPEITACVDRLVGTRK